MAEPDIIVRVFQTAEQVAVAAAELFVESAERAVRARGRFATALSGGTTPLLLFDLLAASTWRPRVAWPAVHVFWSDERCVPPDHPDSNFRLANQQLLQHVDIPPRNIHRIHGELDPNTAALKYDRELDGFLSGGSTNGLDLVFLGLGADGHTASLFPDSDAFLAELAGPPARRVVPSTFPGVAVPRVTMTSRAINASAEVVFLVTGSDKAAAVNRVLELPAEEQPLPARLIRPEGRLTWLVDEAAAGGRVAINPTRCL